MMSPRFQKAMGAIGVLPEDLRPEEPPEVADPSNLEQKATMVRGQRLQPLVIPAPSAYRCLYLSVPLLCASRAQMY